MKVSPSLYSSKLSTLETVKSIRNTISEYIHIDVKGVEKLQQVAEDVKVIRDNSDLFIDVHFIEQKPELCIQELKSISPDFLAIQYEDLADPESFFSLVEGLRDTSVGIAITRKTDFAEVSKHIEESEYVLLMTTIPGESGGSFNDESLRWIESFRKAYPNKRVHVDGGVDDLVSLKIKHLNIDCVVSGSYLMKAESMIASVLKLKGVSLEKRLTRHMLPIANIPMIDASTPLLECLSEIEAGQRGFCFVRNKQKWGILTDGDIRRALIDTTTPAHILDKPINKMVNYNPFSIDHELGVENLLCQLIQQKFDKKLKFIVLTCYNEPIGILDLNKIPRS